MTKNEQLNKKIESKTIELRQRWGFLPRHYSSEILALLNGAYPDATDNSRAIALLSIPHSEMDTGHYRAWYKNVQGFISKHKIDMSSICRACGVQMNDIEICEQCHNPYCEECLSVTDSGHSICWGCIDPANN